MLRPPCPCTHTPHCCPSCHHRHPLPHFPPPNPQYFVDRLRVTDFTVDPTFTAHAGFEVAVTAKNPNQHIGIYYEKDNKLSVWYSDNGLCAGVLSEFYQGHRNDDAGCEDEWADAVGRKMMMVLRQQQTTRRVPLEFRGDVPVRLSLEGGECGK